MLREDSKKKEKVKREIKIDIVDLMGEFDQDEEPEKPYPHGYSSKYGTKESANRKGWSCKDTDLLKIQSLLELKANSKKYRDLEKDISNVELKLLDLPSRNKSKQERLLESKYLELL